mmetsp:Transcript_101247/g.315546  ORF Transcript_101247/g.315546 Transcript_101247/m.315546 type:complete len:328 (-) Transcript_101247:318-1301(-)
MPLGVAPPRGPVQVRCQNPLGRSVVNLGLVDVLNLRPVARGAQGEAAVIGGLVQGASHGVVAHALRGGHGRTRRPGTMLLLGVLQAKERGQPSRGVRLLLDLGLEGPQLVGQAAQAAVLSPQDEVQAHGSSHDLHADLFAPDAHAIQADEAVRPPEGQVRHVVRDQDADLLSLPPWRSRFKDEPKPLPLGTALHSQPELADPLVRDSRPGHREQHPADHPRRGSRAAGRRLLVLEDQVDGHRLHQDLQALLDASGHRAVQAHDLVTLGYPKVRKVLGDGDGLDQLVWGLRSVKSDAVTLIQRGALDVDGVAPERSGHGLGGIGLEQW